MRTIVYATATVLTLATSCTALAGFFSQTLKNPQAIDAFDRYKKPCQKTGTCKSDDKNPPRPRVHAAKDYTGPMKAFGHSLPPLPLRAGPGALSLTGPHLIGRGQSALALIFMRVGAGRSRAFSRACC